MISFDPTDEEKAIREEVRKFAEQELRKRGRDCEKARGVPDDLRRTHFELGLATLDWPLTFTKDQIAPRPICWWALIIRGGTYQNSGDGTVRCRMIANCCLSRLTAIRMRSRR